MNTANCYLVNAAGYYSLPLVYGNAVKKGEQNAAAYTNTTSVTGNNILKTFVNHRGEGITSAYIYKNDGCQPKDACLVWQDEKDLVTNIRLSDNGENLLFDVKKENIKQGNAVVAVRDNSGQIMWSWHIWVTDLKLGSGDIDVTNSKKKTFTFMSQNIGTCSPTTTSYEGRSVQIRFKQNETGITRVATIIQRPDEILSDPGNQPYYQFGRKDPMPPYNEKGDKTIYVTDDQYKFTTEDSQRSLDWSIQNPNRYIAAGNTDWCRQSYTNLWSANNNAYEKSTSPTDDVGQKTIYDPSPVGYCVPPSGAFTGFIKEISNNNEKTDLENDINTPFTSFEDAVTHKGWLFYCKPMTKDEISGVWKKDETSGTIHFAGTGYRRYDTGSGSGYYNQATWAWSSIPTSTQQVHILFAGYYEYKKDHRVNPLYGVVKTFGCIVRPVRENL